MPHASPSQRASRGRDECPGQPGSVLGGTAADTRRTSRPPREHECRRYHSALNQTRQHLRLDHTIGAAATGVLGTDRPQHPQDRRDHVQHFADVLADLVKLTLTARASGRRRLQQLLAARRCLGSAPMLRRAFLRGLSDGFVAGVSSLVGAGSVVASVSRSPSSSASWAATMTASRSEPSRRSSP
ncbi:hypothetical protein ABIF97_004185 [Bradyrhizobium japonicum]